MTESARAIVEVQRRIAALPVPVVARVDGPARAGGLGLVAAADVVVCRDDVTFALTEVRLGLAAATISIPLRHRLTPRAAADWFLTGRPFSAAEAERHGLVTHVADEAGMDAAVGRGPGRPAGRRPAGPQRRQAHPHRRPARGLRARRRGDGPDVRRALPLRAGPGADGGGAAALTGATPGGRRRPGSGEEVADQAGELGGVLDLHPVAALAEDVEL